MGTAIPILWFIVLWLYRKGQFSKWDWLYLLGLLFVGFTTGKRAVMFIFLWWYLYSLCMYRGGKPENMCCMFWLLSPYCST